MKNLSNLKKTIAAFCAIVMFIALVPSAAFAMDLSAYNDAIAQYQAAAQAQMDAYMAKQSEWMDAQMFDAAAAYRIMMSYKTPAEKERYFFTLNEFQRAKLWEYIQYKASIGDFTGIDEPDLALEAELKAEAEAKKAKRAEEEKRKKDPVYAEQKKFEEDYAVQIDLYRKFGDYADLSSVPADVAERIKDFVKKENAIKEAAEKDAFYVPDGVYTLQDDSGKSVTITTTLGGSIKEGDTITLYSQLEGFEDCSDILYVWKVNKGNGFERVPNADGDTYSYQATAESLSWRWNLEVYYRLKSPVESLIP